VAGPVAPDGLPGAFLFGLRLMAIDGTTLDLTIAMLDVTDPNNPVTAAAAHLQALARISRLLRVPGVIDSLRQASTREGLIAVLRDAQAGLPGAQ